MWYQETETNKQKKPSCGQNKEDAAVTCTADSLGPDDSKDKSEHAIWIEAETNDQIPHSSPHPLLIPMQRAMSDHIYEGA